jgi:hypothetical protein
MANSIQYAKTVDVPSVKLKTNELAGRVRIAFAEYEADTEQSTITMFTIPNGARLLSGSVSYDALGYKYNYFGRLRCSYKSRWHY